MGGSTGWHRDFGLIAEEVERIYPQLVQKDSDGRPFSIRYELLSVLLLEEIQKRTEALSVNDNGNVGIGTTSPNSKLAVVGLPAYANNAAAVTGGLAVGDFYRTGGDPDLVCVVH